MLRRESLISKLDSTQFFPYFHPKLFFTSQVNNHNHKKIGSHLQIEIVSLGCPLSPSEIDMQLHRIFCDPFHGFPPPPSPNPFQKQSTIRPLRATNVFKYLICVAVSSHSFPFSLHSDCSKPINMPYSNFLHFSKITQQFKRNSVKIRVKMIPFFGNCEQWFPFSAVGNLSVNCRPTGYRHITNTLPTVSRQC